MLGTNEKNEASIEIRACDGSTKVKIKVDDQSGASITLWNAKNEMAGIDARDDQLSIELCDELGLPRFEVMSNEDSGITARFRIFQPGKGDQDGPHIVVGLDPEGMPGVSLSGDLDRY